MLPKTFLLSAGLGVGSEVTLFMDEDNNLVVVPAERAAEYESKVGLAPVAV